MRGLVRAGCPRTAGKMPALQNNSGFDRMIEAAFFIHKNACQLEGSDHGGRDSAAELALAGTIDVQASDGSCNRLTLGPAPPDAGNYTPPNLSVNGFVQWAVWANQS